jgi:hypothetical protein
LESLGYPLGSRFAFIVMLIGFMALKTVCFRLSLFAAFTSLFRFFVAFLIAGMLHVSCLNQALELWMWLARV